MIEHKPLHDWTSWRNEWTAADVEKALAYADLKDWTFDHWSDGDMQFMHGNPVSFDDLAKLRITFTPLRMVVEAVVDSDVEDELMVLVTMSWNVTSDPEAV